MSDNHTTPRLASNSGGLPSAVCWAQLLMTDRVRAGQTVVDATAGNGHDTLFLCRLVGAGGHVHAMDVQAAAIQETGRRLKEAGIGEECFTLHHRGHEMMRESLPAAVHGRIAGIMFNLGYLPGSDKSLITHTRTTMLAVAAGVELLAAGGLLTIAVYPGHDGGADEQRALSEWLGGLSPRDFEVQLLRPVNRYACPPECWVVWKRG